MIDPNDDYRMWQEAERIDEIKELTVHQNDILCACPNCRKNKGQIVVVAKPTVIKVEVFSKHLKEVNPNDRAFEEETYQLNKYANEDGYWFRYDKI